jgi:hypothetical protein
MKTLIATAVLAFTLSFSANATTDSTFFNKFIGNETTATSVKVMGFTAAITERAVEINWEGAKLGTGYFEVEQSFDGVSFKTAGLVLDGESATAGNATYTFRIKTSSVAGKAAVYFRVKQTSVNGGTAGYSKVFIVKL